MTNYKQHSSDLIPVLFQQGINDIGRWMFVKLWMDPCPIKYFY